jgi:Fe-S cluster assembly protein SufD
MIRVDPGAQQTDAFQESRNLLLTPKAHADAIPGLEIEADDVRCTHAAAIAQVDREQLYYLRARGLSHSDATRLIIDGFLQTLVERTSDGPIRQALSGALEWRLEELLGPGERAEAA